MGEKIVVSLREISDRFGIGIEGARAKAKRRAAKGVWRVLPQNHPADPLRVELPVEEWAEGAQSPQPEAFSAPNVAPQTSAPSQEAQRAESHDIKTLVALLERLTEQAGATTERLISAEREKGEAEVRAAVAIASKEAAEAALTGARAEMESLRERLAAADRQRDDDGKRYSEEVEKALAAGRAEADRARADLEAWRARPWWKRIAG